MLANGFQLNRHFQRRFALELHLIDYPVMEGLHPMGHSPAFLIGEIECPVGLKLQVEGYDQQTVSQFPFHQSPIRKGHAETLDSGADGKGGAGERQCVFGGGAVNPYAIQEFVPVLVPGRYVKQTLVLKIMGILQGIFLFQELGTADDRHGDPSEKNGLRIISATASQVDRHIRVRVGKVRFAVGGMQAQFHIRMLFLEFTDPGHQPPGKKRRCHIDIDGADVGTGHKAAGRGFDLVKGMFHGCQVFFAGGGQHHPPVDPCEQGKLQKCLQGLDLVADCRGGDMQGLGSLVEAAETGGCFKAAQAG